MKKLKAAIAAFLCLILPIPVTIMVIKTPEIFENPYFTNKLELFKLQFDLVEFLNFFSKKFDNNWNCLSDFEYLDPVSEVLTLIVQDYVSQKVNLVQSTPQSEITSIIREKKIEKINN
jgi:hypothetical protein